MSQATIETGVVTTEPAPPVNWDGPAADAWKEAVAATPEPEKPEPEPTKPAPKTEIIEPDKKDAPKPDAIPDDLITGTPEAKKPEADPDEELLNQKPNGQLKHEQFAALQEASKRRIEKVRAEVEAKFKAELEAAKAAPKTAADPEELKTLREALQAKEEALERHAFEQSDRFQNAFTRKEAAIVEQASAYAKSIGADTDAIESAIRQGGSKAVAALNALDLEPGHQQYLINRVAEFDATKSAKEAALAKWKEASKGWAAEEAAAKSAQEAQRVAEEANIFKAIEAKISTQNDLFRPRENNADWNARLEADAAKSARIYNGEATLEQLAEIAVKGIAFDRQSEVITRMRTRLQDALNELAELKNGSPTINGSKPTEKKAEKSDAQDPQALEKAAARGWADALRGG